MTATLDPPSGDLIALSVTRTDSATRVSASGEIDSSSAPQLRDQLDQVLAGDVHEVVVDLQDVTFLDSAGLCVLAGAHRRAADRGARLRIVASSRAVVRPMQITGLWDLLGAELAQHGADCRV